MLPTHTRPLLPRAITLLLVIILLATTALSSPVQVSKAASTAPTQIVQNSLCPEALPEAQRPTYLKNLSPLERDRLAACDPERAENVAPKDWYPSEISRLYGSDTTSGTGLGSAFAYDSTTGTLVVGAYTRDSARGAVYVLVNGMLEAILTASDGIMGDCFGLGSGRLAIAGNTLIVGVPYVDTFRGAVYVFTRTGTTWTQTAKLVGIAASGFFGQSVAFDGNTLVVGASDEQNYSGKV
jgi:hypothetical protein